MRLSEAVPKLESLDVQGAKVFLRVDMNLPIDSSGEIMDETKVRQAARTVRELLDREAAVVVGTHQGRPGKTDFVSTERHAQILSEILGQEVRWVDSVLGRSAREAIESLKPGEVLFLENLRFHSEENIEGPPDLLLRTHFVKRLAPLFDAYVNDAFQAAHRSQPSLVAFPYILPSAAGRLMEDMIREMEEIDSVEGNRLFILGGAKVLDKLRVMEHALRSGRVYEVLCGGLIGVIMAIAAGNRIEAQLPPLKEFQIVLLAAKGILEKFKGRVFYPVDFIVEGEDGRRVVAPVYSVPRGRIGDIGPGTIEVFADRIRQADVVVANGPMGIFEEPEYRRGTIEIVKAAASARRESILCGGHLSVAASLAKVGGARVYTAGGAVMYRLAGLPLPAVDALIGGRRS